MGRSKKITRLLSIVYFILPLVMLLKGSSVSAMTSAQEGPDYVVQSGDTLSSIALQFGVEANELQSINQLSDPNALAVGQRLTIPGLEGIDGLMTSQTIAFGDSLKTLMRAYQLDQNVLMKLNRLSSPNEVIAGAKFIIPINETADPLTATFGMPQGLTLLETAIHLGTSPWSIQQENQLSGSWDSITGEVIFTKSDTDLATSLLPRIDQISLYPLPLIQGETTEISVRSSSEKDVTGYLEAEKLKFFTEDSLTYTSYYGTHAFAEVGLFPLEIITTDENGNMISYNQLVRVASGGYGNEVVTVGDEYLDQDAIAEENSFMASFFEDTSSDKYWDGRFQYPVDEYCINSTFGQRRNYNDGAYFFYHTGMDFGVCAPNLNIYAPAAGKVILAEPLTIKGNAILIDHGWGVFSGYWHLSEFNVEVGDFVEPGDLIGLIGNTGRSAGPHLHFEIDIHGTPVNPQTWLSETFPKSAP